MDKKCANCRYYKIGIRVNICEKNGKAQAHNKVCEKFEQRAEQPWENQIKQCDACKHYPGNGEFCKIFQTEVSYNDICARFEWAEEQVGLTMGKDDGKPKRGSHSWNITPLPSADAYAQGFADGHREGLAQAHEEEGTSKRILEVCISLYHFLREKNKRYGDSALHPIGVFAKDGAAKGLYLRADDKLSRIQNSAELRKNDCVDLMGYLVLMCIEHGWMDWRDQID